MKKKPTQASWWFWCPAGPRRWPWPGRWLAWRRQRSWVPAGWSTATPPWSTRRWWHCWAASHGHSALLAGSWLSARPRPYPRPSGTTQRWWWDGYLSNQNKVNNTAETQTVNPSHSLPYPSAAAWSRHQAALLQSPQQRWCHRQLQCPGLWTVLPADTNTDVQINSWKASTMLQNQIQDITILAAGWRTCICFKMVAPSLVIVTSPFSSWIWNIQRFPRLHIFPRLKCQTSLKFNLCSLTILSIPLGPRLVLMASATAAKQTRDEEQLH